MPEVIYVLSELAGKVFRAIKGDYDLKENDSCIIDSEFGGDLVVVINVSSRICKDPKAAKDTVKIIRKATEDDKTKFKHKTKKILTRFGFSGPEKAKHFS